MGMGTAFAHLAGVVVANGASVSVQKAHHFVEGRFMARVSALTHRFAELVVQIEDVEKTKRQEHGIMEGTYVDEDELLNWKVKARNLLSLACGKESEHYKAFITSEHYHGMDTNYQQMKRLKAVFLAAKEDFDGGYLDTIRHLIQAELFDNELEQASELHASGYKLPAAVVAGVVLETNLRQMCTDRNITPGKLDKMNADLAKAGAYSVLVQKQITALADIRNNAAHGHSEKFTDAHVSNMISQIRNLLISWL